MAANHRGTNVINANINALIALIRDPGFSGALNISMKSENPTPVGVWYRFHHGVSFSSWGEKITITLTYINDYSTNVDIHSECGMPTQVIDWGKNKRIVCNIFENIEANIGRFAQVAPAQSQQPVQPQQPQQPTGANFCTKCGARLAMGGNFCTKCGAKIG